MSLIFKKIGYFQEDELIENAAEIQKTEDIPKPKTNRLQFLHSCPLTKFLHHPRNENSMFISNVLKFKDSYQFKNVN